jgi:hypothetical protein
MGEDFNLEELFEINLEAIKKEAPELDEETAKDEAWQAALEQHLDQELSKSDALKG